MSNEVKEIYSTTKVEIDTEREEDILETFKQCEEIMSKHNWSWQGEDGLPLAPIEMIKLFDKICDIMLNGDE